MQTDVRDAGCARLDQPSANARPNLAWNEAGMCRRQARQASSPAANPGHAQAVGRNLDFANFSFAAAHHTPTGPGRSSGGNTCCIATLSSSMMACLDGQLASGPLRAGDAAGVGPLLLVETLHFPVQMLVIGRRMLETRLMPNHLLLHGVLQMPRGKHWAEDPPMQTTSPAATGRRR